LKWHARASAAFYARVQGGGAQMSRGTAAADLESARQNRRIFREAARGTLRFCNQVFDLGAEFAVGAKLVLSIERRLR
jgi:hypothetical protein